MNITGLLNVDSHRLLKYSLTFDAVLKCSATKFQGEHKFSDKPSAQINLAMFMVL